MYTFVFLNRQARGREGQKTNPFSLLWAIQSIKPVMVNWPIQKKKNRKRQLFIVIIPSFTRPFCFLSQHLKHTQRSCLPILFFLFRPTKDPYQLNRVPLTTKWITHTIPNRENNCCKVLALRQCRSKWSINSSSILHI